MAYATISKPSLHFNTKLYTGNGSVGNSITGVGFQPDWVWIKNRSSAYNHFLFDVVRGVQKAIISDLNVAEDTKTSSLTAFGTDGFTVGTYTDTNTNNENMVSWNWKASGSTASNTDGTINSTVSANTTAGFSIVKFSPTGSGSVKTVGHGLGEVPKMIIMKRYTGTVVNWLVYHVSTGNGNSLYLDTSDASTSVNYWNSTTPTSSVFTVNGAAEASGDFIAYCFAEKKGYSKFGSYTGNGNADGTFVYTGFKPAFLITKNYSQSGDSWNLLDATRNPGNPGDKRLTPDVNSAEATTTQYDILSNGFKVRATTGAVNNSNASYIYMAFAEEPLVANVGESIPATAR